MIFECSAIILVILIMSFMCLKGSKKSGWSIGMLPLILVPAGHITGSWLNALIATVFRITPIIAWISIDICVLMVTCLMLGIISLQIKKSRLRIAYLVVCGLFSAILTCVLIVRSILVL